MTIFTPPCAGDGCEQSAAPWTGRCEECLSHHCFAHRCDDQVHECLSESSKVARRIFQAAWKAADKKVQLEIDEYPITRLAEEARSEEGKSHKAEIVNRVLADLPSGGSHVHIPVRFNDGVEWLARKGNSPLDRRLPAIDAIFIQTEIAAMRWLAANGFPVPEVHGEPYRDMFFIDKVPGKPCPAPIFVRDVQIPDPSHATLTKAIIDKILRQVAQFYISLSEHPFEGIGSLYPRACPSGVSRTEGSRCQPTVGPLVNFHFSLVEPPHFLGPFKTNGERWLAIIDFILQAIKDGAAFADEDETRFLLYIWIRDFVKDYEPFHRVEPTFLRHADDKGDHIMIDEEGNVTGYIDWEWAYVCPAYEAFGVPEGLINHKILETGSNLFSKYERKLARILDEAGRTDLGNYVRGSRLHMWLRHVVGDPWMSEPDIWGLHEAMGQGKLTNEEKRSPVIENRMKEKYGINGEMSKQEIYDMLARQYFLYVSMNFVQLLERRLA